MKVCGRELEEQTVEMSREECEQKDLSSLEAASREDRAACGEDLRSTRDAFQTGKLCRLKLMQGDRIPAPLPSVPSNKGWGKLLLFCFFGYSPPWPPKLRPTQSDSI